MRLCHHAAPMIEVERLSKTYRPPSGDVEALREVSFEAQVGEAVALLGANGAGKSTAMRILATLLAPDSGRVSVAGYDALRQPMRVRSVIGVAAQSATLPRKVSARRLLWHHARAHGLRGRAARDRVDDLLGSCELEAVADRPSDQCSGGERRRLDLALALVHGPPVLLLDEPTTGIDALSRRRIWRQLTQELDAGTTVVFTTHDLLEADTHADRVVMIKAGRLTAHGAPRALKRSLGAHHVRLWFFGADDADSAAAKLGRAYRPSDDHLVVPISASREVADVLRQLDAEGIEVRDLALDAPTLENVFERVIDAPNGQP